MAAIKDRFRFKTPTPSSQSKPKVNHMADKENKEKNKGENKSVEKSLIDDYSGPLKRY